MFKNKLTKKSKIIIILLSTLAILGAYYVATYQLNIIKPPIIKSYEYHCSPDNCPSANGKNLEGSIDIYFGINTKDQCIRIGGDPILVWGISGQEFYDACAVK